MDMEIPVSIDVGTKLVALVENAVSIHCKASGLPEPVISWRKDGQRVTFGELYELLRNNTLVISQAQEEDSGSYVCTARNFLGKDSATSQVEVIGKKENHS